MYVTTLQHPDLAAEQGQIRREEARLRSVGVNSSVGDENFANPSSTPSGPSVRAQRR
jgi:hypothetical protein